MSNLTEKQEKAHDDLAKALKEYLNAYGYAVPVIDTGARIRRRTDELNLTIEFDFTGVKRTRR